jgi:hypothetical protein
MPYTDFACRIVPNIAMAAEQKLIPDTTLR